VENITKDRDVTMLKQRAQENRNLNSETGSTDHGAERISNGNSCQASGKDTAEKGANQKEPSEDLEEAIARNGCRDENLTAKEVI
jgi:uncharacterized phage infection (PIP) family protein YhgE